MAQCVECGAETLLYVNGVPICSKCDDKAQKPPPTPAKPQPKKK